VHPLCCSSLGFRSARLRRASLGGFAKERVRSVGFLGGSGAELLGADGGGPKRQVPGVEAVGFSSQAPDRGIPLGRLDGGELCVPVHQAGAPATQAHSLESVLSVRYVQHSSADPSVLSLLTDPSISFLTLPDAVTVGAVACIGIAEALEPNIKQKKEEDL